MILVVLAVVAVSYYAVVISNYGLEVLQGGSRTAIALLVLLLFHVLVRTRSNSDHSYCFNLHVCFVYVAMCLAFISVVSQVSIDLATLQRKFI
jgi:hypothetical protein